MPTPPQLSPEETAALIAGAIRARALDAEVIREHVERLALIIGEARMDRPADAEAIVRDRDVILVTVEMLKLSVAELFGAVEKLERNVRRGPFVPL